MHRKRLETAEQMAATREAPQTLIDMICTEASVDTLLRTAGCSPNVFVFGGQMHD